MRGLSDAAQFRTTPLCWESEIQDEKQTQRLLVCLAPRNVFALPNRSARDPAEEFGPCSPLCSNVSSFLSLVSDFFQDKFQASFWEWLTSRALPKGRREETILIWFPPP